MLATFGRLKRLPMFQCFYFHIIINSHVISLKQTNKQNQIKKPPNPVLKKSLYSFKKKKKGERKGGDARKAVRTRFLEEGYQDLHFPFSCFKSQMMSIQVSLFCITTCHPPQAPPRRQGVKWLPRDWDGDRPPHWGRMSDGSALSACSRDKVPFSLGDTGRYISGP